MYRISNRLVLSGTFELFMGNIELGDNNDTQNNGWGSLKDLESAEIGDLYSSLSNIGDLVQSIFLVSVGKNTFNDFESGPLCLRSKPVKCLNTPLEERVI